MIERNITNIIRDNMFDYSAYVDLDRAIPSVESGLKPSLERILWTMYEGKNFKFTNGAKLYFDSGDKNARFAAYFYGEDFQWENMTECYLLLFSNILFCKFSKFPVISIYFIVIN